MDWKLKVDAEPQGSSNGFWYDLAVGGYIDLDVVLDDEDQISRVEEALELLRSLEVALRDANILEEY